MSQQQPARRSLWRDLRSGRASGVVRIGLSVATAAVTLSITMGSLAMIEASAGWLNEVHIAIALGIAGAAWCGMLALIWWTFRRFQLALKSAFAMIAIWAVALASVVVIEDVARRGEEFMIAAVLLLAIALSVGAVIQICYGRVRNDPEARAMVRVRVCCPQCGYSLVGLTDCRCPECGSQFTVESLIEAVGQGQVVTDRPLDVIETPALPEGGDAAESPPAQANDYPKLADGHTSESA